MWYRLVVSVISLFCFCPRAHADTLHVYFPNDVAFLNEEIEKQIDKHLDRIKNQKQVLVIGYASKDGDTYYNDMLSMRRAQNVARYLVSGGTNETNIKLVYGRGEVKRSRDEQHLYRYDRRVDIVTGEEPEKKPAPPQVAHAVLKPVETVTEKLDSVSIGGTLALNNIQFVPGLAIPLRSSDRDFVQLLEAMTNNPKLRIQIEGHICCEDEPQGDTTGHGYQLSVSRAKTVYLYLKLKGISPDRMDFKGFSSWNRLVPEDSEENKAKNRRVEIRVLGK